MVQIQIILFSVFSASFINGIEVGWSGPALKILTSSDSPIPLDKSDVSWLAFATTLGELTTILLCGIIFRNFGRKTLTLCCSVFLVLSWLLNTIAASYGALLISQFLINASIGIHDVTYCVYVSEIASAENRGVFIALFLLFFNFGIESIYLMALFDDYNYLNMFPLIVSIASLVLCFYAVESPYYLLTRNKNDEAWKSLSYLNANEDFHQIAQEYDELTKIVREDSTEKNYFKFLLSTENYKMYLCVCVIYVVVYANSSMLFLSYVTIVFDQFADVMDFHIIMNFIGFLNIVCVVVSPFIIEKFGRRSLVLLGFSGTAILHLFIAVCFYIDDSSSNHPKYLPTAVIIAGFMFIIIFVTMVHPVGHVLKSEMLPIKLRNSGSCVMEVLKSIVQGMVITLFIPIASKFGMGLNFFVYFVTATLGTYFVYTRLKETKGKTLCEIRNDYAEF